jgi:iron(III) transport system substrate-binding protein
MNLRSSRSRRVGTRLATIAIGLLVLAALLSGCGGSSSSSTSTSTNAAATTGGSGNSTSSLVAEAKKEGTVIIYSTLGPAQNQAIVTSFQKAYPGIQLQMNRPGAGTQVETRVTAQESAGEHSVDLVLLGDDPCPFVTAHPSWFESWEGAGIPNYTSFTQTDHQWIRSCGSYQYPVLGVTEWGIAYNTSQVKSPPTWQDLLQPQYKGKLLLADPRIADAYYSIWYLLLKTYGAGFLQQLGKESKLQSGGLQAAQEVAAGGAPAVIPSHVGVTNSIKATAPSAPIGIANPSPTVGLELNFVPMAANIAPHPAATKLLLGFLLTKSANEALNAPAGYSVFDSARFKDYTVPDYAASIAAKNEIDKDLGLG